MMENRILQKIARSVDNTTFTLDLHGEGLEELPDSIANLTSLRSLDLWNNSLTDISALRNLKRLQSLDLGSNNLTDISALRNLTQLQKLDLSSNKLTDISILKELPGLQVVCLNHNQLSHIPDWLAEAPQLLKLYLFGNPLENVPPELLGEDEASSVFLPYMRSFLQQLAVGRDILCEAKLLIVGEGEAGKTSLCRKILDPQAQLPKPHEGTSGIKVSDWTFKEMLSVKSEMENFLQEHDLTIHIWDFAGQEITYATHQFFLTKRSVYALVIDSRRDNPNFDYWLNIIELLSDKSPLVIVKNEKADNKCIIDEKGARARFSNIRHVFETNLMTNRGLSNTVRGIQNLFRTLPHVGEVLPKTWKVVRERLRELELDYIPVYKYRDICWDVGFKDHDNQNQLSEYLHDIGVHLHFQKDPGLAEWIILRPEWATKAVYRVLRDQQVNNALGRFTQEDLDRIWHERIYEPVRSALLQLMCKFQLCYRLPVEDAYIIPQLLPPSQPEIEWSSINDDSTEIQIRYTYEFMPKGIITDFIVAMAVFVERQNWVWRQGVVLASDGARALVVEEPKQSQVSVRVSGRNSHLLLGTIRNEMIKIHKRFKGIKVKRWIPCPCETCHKEPYLFDISRVHEAMRKNAEGLQCQNSFKMIAPNKLLDRVGEGWSDDERPRSLLTHDEASHTKYRQQPSPAPLVVYLSYKWGGKSENLTNVLEEQLNARGLEVIRDKTQIRYRDDIEEFMDMLSSGHCVVVILSDGYLKSLKCMRELVGIFRNEDFCRRVFPVIMADADIHSPHDRYKYIKFWKEEKDKLNTAVCGEDLSLIPEIAKDIQLHDDILRAIDRLSKSLSRMHTLTPDQHQINNFRTIALQIKDRHKKVRR
ncbi:MAG: TIR domain-containing protein [Proteobacteria bacterium]|nr:TIR domain-containing protein [Pseudomonadota bacterium]